MFFADGGLVPSPVAPLADRQNIAQPAERKALHRDARSKS